jgi:poly(3-hydroxybutyrate) depolymerase
MASVGGHAWMIAALAAGCGRIGFEHGQAPDARLVTGASTADLELCLGPASYWITTAPVADGWRADTLADRIAALPPGAVLHHGHVDSDEWCTTIAGLPIGPEQIAIHAYAVTDAQSDVAEAEATMQPTWTRELTPGGVTVWVHRPEAMYRDPSVSAPALVFFHGWGHSTNVNANGAGVDTMPRDSGFLELFGQDIRGANPPRTPSLVDLPFLVLAPNCVEGGTLGTAALNCWGWASSDAIYDETIGYARGRFPIDAHRVYATGLSTGGEGAVRIAITRPSQIAAVVAIASTLTNSQWFADRMCSAAKVPVWAFHSSHDVDQTTYMNSQAMVDWMNRCSPGPSERAQVDLGDWSFQGQGHAGWYEVYGDTHGKTHGAFTSIYPWLLAHAR